MSVRITNEERRTILSLFYRNRSRREIQAVLHRSLATIQRVIVEHVQRVRDHGLILTLSEENLTEPLELARLYGELERAGISVNDCRGAVPIVERCRQLQVEEEQVGELIAAALRIGDPEFPRAEFADSLLRILRLERETGQTVQQIQRTHQELADDTRTLTAQGANLRNEVGTLERRRVELQNAIQDAEGRLRGLREQLEASRVTETQLAIYLQDRQFLGTVGVDIRNARNVSIVFTQLAALNYNPRMIVDALLVIENVRQQVLTLRENLNRTQNDVNHLTQQRDQLTNEIRGLEQQLEDSKKRTQEQLDKEHTTEQDLADFVATKKTLREAGIEL